MQIIEENVSKQELKDFLYYGMSIDDKSLYRQVNRSQANVFQFSGGTAADMVQRARPQSFDDLVGINALSRPGSSFSFNDFVANGDSGRSKYPEPIARFLTESHGCILYQEEVMKLVESLSHGKVRGNYARGLLKKLGKAKKSEEDIEAWKKVVETIKEETQGILKESEIEEFAEDLATLSAYSFNKSHAAAYTYVACMTLYMTCYCKPYFWAASLTYDATKLDALKSAIKNAQKDGFKILPPDVNTSDLHFTPLPDGIRFGLNEIKGIGEEPAETVISLRPYESVIDFIVKTLGTKINKRIVLALIGGGAFDNLIEPKMRRKYLKITEDFYERKKTKKNPDILKELWEDTVEDHQLDSETSPQEFMDMEKTYLSGSFFHGIFSDEMAEKIDKLHELRKCLRSFQEIRESDTPGAYCPVHVVSYRPWVQKNGESMCFIECEDMNSEQVSIPVFASYWEFVKTKFFGEGFYLLKVFDKDGQIMFGSRSWLNSPDSKRACMIRWNIT